MVVNRRITDNFKNFSEKNSNFPESILELLNDYLKTADRNDLDNDQMISLYDQFLDKYVDNKKILKWSEKKVESTE